MCAVKCVCVVSLFMNSFCVLCTRYFVLFLILLHRFWNCWLFYNHVSFMPLRNPCSRWLSHYFYSLCGYCFYCFWVVDVTFTGNILLFCGCSINTYSKLQLLHITDGEMEHDSSRHLFKRSSQWEVAVFTKRNICTGIHVCVKWSKMTGHERWLKLGFSVALTEQSALLL